MQNLSGYIPNILPQYQNPQFIQQLQEYVNAHNCCSIIANNQGNIGLVENGFGQPSTFITYDLVVRWYADAHPVTINPPPISVASGAVTVPTSTIASTLTVNNVVAAQQAVVALDNESPAEKEVREILNKYSKYPDVLSKAVEARYIIKNSKGNYILHWELRQLIESGKFNQDHFYSNLGLENISTLSWATTNTTAQLASAAVSKSPAANIIAAMNQVFSEYPDLIDKALELKYIFKKGNDYVLNSNLCDSDLSRFYRSLNLDLQGKKTSAVIGEGAAQAIVDTTNMIIECYRLLEHIKTVPENTKSNVIINKMQKSSLYKLKLILDFSQGVPYNKDFIEKIKALTREITDFPQPTVNENSGHFNPIDEQFTKIYEKCEAIKNTCIEICKKDFHSVANLRFDFLNNSGLGFIREWRDSLN